MLRVVRLRHYVDTAKHIAAFAGEDTTAWMLTVVLEDIQADKRDS